MLIVASVSGRVLHRDDPIALPDGHVALPQIVVPKLDRDGGPIAIPYQIPPINPVEAEADCPPFGCKPDRDEPIALPDEPIALPDGHVALPQIVVPKLDRDGGPIAIPYQIPLINLDRHVALPQIVEPKLDRDEPIALPDGHVALPQIVVPKLDRDGGPIVTPYQIPLNNLVHALAECPPFGCKPDRIGNIVRQIVEPKLDRDDPIALP